ncbi:putative hydrolase of HD superfamily [Fontibacillus solani]|uniref:Putative hydrolase of HD superfamily n=1 Tax=Fontibacillus solani TaxID=1572857 RepID=A0A7W3SXN3_9BACL|nr:HD domain-containing protein [Fontibacillus solani]MBA9087833.1 putative hydrolase of HD superfamily [Fontibacillus solani]
MNRIMRLQQQVEYIREIDKLKSVLRQSLLMDASRQENDAEHTWHLAVMAVLLQEYAKEPLSDMTRILKMLLIHDIVEIDAGDTFAYDEKGYLDKREREERAANRIFGLLPPDQKEEMLELWKEFESERTAESRYAAAIDRLQPLLHNYYTEGAAWRKHGVKSSQVLARISKLSEVVPELHEYASGLIHDAVVKGYLAE